MSVEEEVELRDMVAQTLELNGSLPKIRAQLRASLFLALDEDSKISKQQPLLNTKVKAHLEAPEGQLMFCLVREFLEYLGLDFTASVYDPESYAGNLYKYEGRQKTLEDLGLKPSEGAISGPLLLHLVRIAQTKSKTLQINLNVNGEKDSPIHVNGHKGGDESVDENPLHATFVKKDAENDDTFNGTSSIEEELNGDSKADQDSSPRSKSDKLKTKLNKDLLPSLYKKSNKDYDFEIKDDYEEDFMSGSELDFSQSRPLSEELQESQRSSERSDNKSSSSQVGTNSSDV